MTGTAARLVDCHPATVRRAVERGDLEATRLGPRGADASASTLYTHGNGAAHDPKDTP
jgi:hypothetical protein